MGQRADTFESMHSQSPRVGFSSTLSLEHAQPEHTRFQIRVPRLEGFLTHLGLTASLPFHGSRAWGVCSSRMNFLWRTSPKVAKRFRVHHIRRQLVRRDSNSLGRLGRCLGALCTLAVVRLERVESEPLVL